MPERIHGETWHQWARRQFEFENCSECGKGVRNHLPAIVLGNWFAVCKETPKWSDEVPDA